MQIEKGQKYLCVKERDTGAQLGKLYYAPADHTLQISALKRFVTANKDTLSGFQSISSAKWAIKLISREITDYISKRNLWRYGNMVFQKGITDRKYFTSDGRYSEFLPDGYTEIDFETFKEITGMGEEKVYTIEDLSNGFCALINDGTLEDLKEVIGIAFKGDSAPEGKDRFYQLDIDRSDSYEKKWDGRNSTYLKTQSVHKFLTQIYKKEEQKIFTIEDVRNGKCAIENDGTVHQIRTILAYAFPESGVCANDFKYYMQSGVDSKKWVGKNYTDLPTQPVKLFLSQIESEKTPIQKAVEKLGEVRVKEIIDEVAAKQPVEEWQPKWGEPVEVSNDEEDWDKGWLYMTEHPLDIDGLGRFVVTDNDGMICQFYFIRKPLEIHTFTTEQAKQDLAKLHNLNVNQIKIVE